MAVEKNHLVFVAKQASNLTIIYLLNGNNFASVLPSECSNSHFGMPGGQTESVSTVFPLDPGTASKTDSVFNTLRFTAK